MSDNQAFGLFVLFVLIACAAMFFAVRWLTRRLFASSYINEEAKSYDVWVAILVVVAGLGFVGLLEFVNETAATIWAGIMIIAAINASAIAGRMAQKDRDNGT